MRQIFDRLVAQQIDANPAPLAVTPTLPERGQVVTFTRCVQIDGTAPLTLELKLTSQT